MNPVLADILQSKQTLSGDGTRRIDVHSAISLEEGELLSRLIAERKPKVSLEVGLAFGISALFICEAMKAATAEPRHIVIDPAQHAEAYWKGAGLANLDRAGYRQFVEFIEKPSQIALPELVAAGRRIDFAFIDGEHTFDHVLVDFFFVDQLLNTGGVVVFDDTGWPSIRRVARFVASNRNYKVIGHIGTDDSPRTRRLQNATPDPRETDKGLGLQGECIAFEKLGNDTRQCDYFVEF
ncbi:MAG TPA: class I SAM-dependent methyltransferase [Tepidisphaeraceae bacterium]|nr:class I SAM-dependent methyltransferase [Tepidisphaeraceae bacterium]